MGVYIFPIFCFGLVITGIVMIGVQQASDLAKQLAAQSTEAEQSSNSPELTPASQSSLPDKLLPIVNRT